MVVACSTRHRLWWILPVLLAAIHLVHGLLRRGDLDEFQYLTNAFDASRGLLPYVDYWDNHGPLNIWFLAPLVDAWRGGHGLLQMLRVASWFNTMLLSGLLIWLSRYLYPGKTGVGFFAVVFILSAPSFMKSALEVRADNPANTLFVLSTILVILGRGTGRWIYYFATGICLGLMAGITLKFLIAGAAVLLFYGTLAIWNRTLPPIRPLLFMGSGVLLPVVIMVGIMHYDGNLPGFIDCYLGGNVNREPSSASSRALVDILKKAPLWGAWALAAIVLFGDRMARRRATDIEAALWVTVVFFLVQFVFVLPTRYLQSLLPIYFPLAILGGRLGADVLSREFQRRQAVMATAAAILGAVLLIAGIHNYANLRNSGLPKQINFADSVLSHTGKDSPIFDPDGLIFLKPKPGPFHIWVRFIREMHSAGVIDLNMPRLMDSHNVQWAILGDRTRDLRRSDLQYLMENFGPISQEKGTYLLARGPLLDEPLPWPQDIMDKASTPSSNPVDPPQWYKNFMKRYTSRNP